MRPDQNFGCFDINHNGSRGVGMRLIQKCLGLFLEFCLKRELCEFSVLGGCHTATVQNSNGTEVNLGSQRRRHSPSVGQGAKKEPGQRQQEETSSALHANGITDQRWTGPSS